MIRSTQNLKLRRDNQRWVPASKRRRRGALVPLACVAFFSMLALAGLSVNIAYIEMVRTEQRLATDAAAKAALITLGQTQSVTQTRTVAKQIAALHKVGGAPLVLSDSDIQIGTSVRNLDGTYTFAATNPSSPTVVTNSIQVQSKLGSGSGISVAMVPQMLGKSTFTATQSAISTRIDMDVCLVVDRSGSMAWDLTSTAFSYPGALHGKSAMQNYFKLPDPSLSRWAALRSSVNSFLSVLNEGPIQTRVALASYSSNFTFGVFTSTVSSLDLPLSTDNSSIPTKMDSIASQPLIGNTNIAAGLREGINALTDPARARITSCKTIILLTDGIKSQGDDPIALAAQARDMNVRIHTIAFSAQADVQLMQKVAQAGGGQCYVAPDAATLTTVFRSIAATLPNMLTN